MTPEEQKLQAAIAAAMSLPSEPEPSKESDSLVPQPEVASSTTEGVPQESPTPPVQAAQNPVASAQEVPQKEERDWSQVDEMLNESFEGRQKKKKTKGVLVNTIFCFLCLGVIGSAAYWYVSSDSNQAKVSSLWNDVKSVKDDMNPAKIVDSYQESLDKIEAHQDRLNGENSFSWDAVEKAEEGNEPATAAVNKNGTEGGGS